jgi:RNA polymerase sigma factor (sigma-70 family)
METFEQQTDRLYRHFKQPMITFVTRKYFNREFAQLVVQETFLKILECRPHINKATENAFIIRCIKNMAYSLREQNVVASKKLPCFQLPPEELEDDSILSGYTAMCNRSQIEEVRVREHEMIRHHYFKILRETIETKLPPQCKKIIKMAVYDQLTNAEIAKSMGLSVYTVKFQRVRGLKLLRAAFSKMNLNFNREFV